MIILAHDGSIYSDWVARYAIRIAASEQDRKLLLLHVQDGKICPEVVESRLSLIASECDSFDVEFLPEYLSLGSSVYRSLRQAIPPSPDALFICGTRVKSRKNHYLAGSVAEKLLRMHECPILALRVVQPGLLGNPHDLLLPLAGHLQGFSRVEPIFRRLASQLRSVHVCRIMQVNSLRHPHLSPDMEHILKRKGSSYLSKFRFEMEATLDPVSFRCDQKVIISPDWAHEVLMQANRLKAQLLLLGLSERSLAYRVLHSAAIEKILHETPCDIGIYRG